MSTAPLTNLVQMPHPKYISSDFVVEGHSVVAPLLLGRAFLEK